MVEGTILLVDDEPVAARDSIAALEHFVAGEQILYVENAECAISLLETKPVALVFLDIEMPGNSGFELAAYIEKQQKGIPYVFLTGHADFAVESYEYEPLDFLTKPVDIVRLGKTFERLEHKRALSGMGKVAIRSGQDYVMVEPDQISHICKERRKVWIEMKNGVRYPAGCSLDELERIFSDYGFFRCHQSFLIPIRDIRQVSASMFGQTYEVELAEGIRIPVSRSKYAKLKEELEHRGVPFVRGTTSK